MEGSPEAAASGVNQQAAAAPAPAPASAATPKRKAPSGAAADGAPASGGPASKRSRAAAAPASGGVAVPPTVTAAGGGAGTPAGNSGAAGGGGPASGAVDVDAMFKLNQANQVRRGSGGLRGRWRAGDLHPWCRRLVGLGGRHVRAASKLQLLLAWCLSQPCRSCPKTRRP